MKKITILALLGGIFSNLSAAENVEYKTMPPKPANAPVNIQMHQNSSQLNNLVQAIAFTSRSKDAMLSVEFTVQGSKAHWVFLQFTVPMEDFQLLCDGKVIADNRVLVKNQEAMLELAPGKYIASAKAIRLPDGKAPEVLRLNRIPGIYYYAPGNVGGMEVLDGSAHWQQIGDQLLSSTNLLAPAALNNEERQLYRQAGRKIFFNTASRPVSDHQAEVFAANVQSKLDQDSFDGFTVDEFAFGDPAGSMGYLDYGKALSMIKNPSGKYIYTWSYGVKYPHKPEQFEFVKTCITPPGGKGRLMTEIYLETRETESEARDFLEKRIVNEGSSVLRKIPGLAPDYGIVLGIFNAMPILTLETVPEVDYKYYLDMQMYILANNPAFQDLGLVGYWGGNYCQEELQRWALLLMRHYFVEGNKNMLSTQYGFKYRPEILQNGDFLRSLAHWKSFPAEENSIRQDKVQDHGYLMQCRWGDAKSYDGVPGSHDGSRGQSVRESGNPPVPYNGDTAVVFTKSSQGANTISQRMVNLVPGKTYVLHYVVGSYDDAVNKVNNPREYGIDAEFDNNSVIIMERKLYVDRRENHRYRPEPGFSRSNLHRIIFVPQTREVTLRLTDKNSKEPAGTQLMVNFVQVKPYFAKDMMP